MPPAGRGGAVAGLRSSATGRWRRSVRRRPGKLGEERARAGAVGEHGHPVTAAGDGDVEHAPLLLDVLGQAVGDDAVGDAEHGDAVPLATLHPVDRRQRHPAGGRLAREGRAQPRLEAGRVGVQVGDTEEALEVVEVARSLPAAGAVEQAHRRAETDLVADGLEHRPRGAAAPDVEHDAEVVGEAQHLAALLVRHLVDQRGELGQRPARPPSEALGEPLRQPTRRPAQDLDDVVGGHRVGRRRQSQVGERGAHAGALEHVGAQHRADRHTGLVQRHVWRQQQRVHPGQHGDRRRRHVRLVEPRPHDRHRSRGAVVAAVLDDAQRASRSVVLGSGVDLLADATVVVAEQRARTGDDIDGAAVVHRERVRDRPGEQSLVVDEEAPGRRRRGRRCTGRRRPRRTRRAPDTPAGG